MNVQGMFLTLPSLLSPSELLPVLLFSPGSVESAGTARHTLPCESGSS